jgi:hypothetical protein
MRAGTAGSKSNCMALDQVMTDESTAQKTAAKGVFPPVTGR